MGNSSSKNTIMAAAGDANANAAPNAVSPASLRAPPSAHCSHLASSARTASRVLQSLSGEKRVALLLRIADLLEERTNTIMAANADDVARADAQGTLPPATRQRLALKEGKIKQVAAGTRAVARQQEPIGRVVRRCKVMDDDEHGSGSLTLEKVTAPMGVLLVIFEARPDALPQIASLALKAGNGALLKGGREATQSNKAIHACIAQALTEFGVPPACITLVDTRDEVDGLLACHDTIDMVVPRGSNQLCTYVMENTKIPVLGHADGVCHVYVDKAADPLKANRILVDAKTDYPAACNAAETCLVHMDHFANPHGYGHRLLNKLTEEGIKVLAGPRMHAIAGCAQLPTTEDMHVEYGDLTLMMEVVDDVDAAIAHINANSSSHTECVVTEDEAVREKFLNAVDSACVFANCSTRFSDGFRFGLGAEVRLVFACLILFFFFVFVENGLLLAWLACAV
ncbi:aldehyde dehydrogenase [Pycnococcus provasolii]|uniref:glutamate-5-semialdehyde dehydrogenase n=1 Tax=Pycnococcus provasolii TaxID=41880 RepID=A0A830I0I8_9CHLO|nr:aldehyde dehydrogenase [Pycnococcus provasolii]